MPSFQPTLARVSVVPGSGQGLAFSPRSAQRAEQQPLFPRHQATLLIPRRVRSRAGFVENAEVMNSRAAMIGFFALLFVEAVRGRSSSLPPLALRCGAAETIRAGRHHDSPTL